MERPGVSQAAYQQSRAKPTCTQLVRRHVMSLVETMALVLISLQLSVIADGESVEAAACEDSDEMLLLGSINDAANSCTDARFMCNRSPHVAAACPETCGRCGQHSRWRRAPGLPVNKIRSAGPRQSPTVETLFHTADAGAALTRGPDVIARPLLDWDVDELARFVEALGASLDPIARAVRKLQLDGRGFLPALAAGQVAGSAWAMRELLVELHAHTQRFVRHQDVR